MPDEPLEARTRAVVAAIFNMPVEQIDAQSSSQTIEAWDSMGHLMLTLELEQEFGVQIPPEDVEQMTSVAAIAQVLARCGAV